MALGYPDVDALLDGMSSRQWSEWQVFWRTYGWGERRMDVRFAKLMALIANLVGGRDGEPVGIEHFLPDEDTDEDTVDDEYGEYGEYGDYGGGFAAPSGGIVDEDQLIFEAMVREGMGEPG